MDARNSPDVPFDLKGDSADFRSKKTDVFGSLDDIEKSYQSNLAVRSENDNEEAEKDLDGSREEVVSHFDDSSFKRPRSPGHCQRSAYSRRREFRSKAWSRRDDFNWRNTKPEFEKNPDKWKKYTLEDTSVCGNTQNSKVAFDLIRQLKERRDDEGGGTGGESAAADLDQKMVFSKPDSKIDNATEKQESNNDDVHKMQEYDFGVKIPRNKATHKPEHSDSDSKVNLPNSALTLQHLDEELHDYASHANKQSDDSPKLPLEEGSNIEKTATTPAKRGLTEEADQVVSVAVGFKKRRGKRNIRHRQDEQDD